MSWFSGADMSEDPASTSQDDGFLSPSPSLRSFTQRDRVEIGSNISRNDFEELSCPSWHTPIAHGLGLLTLPVTTDGGSDMTMTSQPYIYQPTTTSLSWPSESPCSAPSGARTQTARKVSPSDQSCNPLSTLLPGALWDHLRPNSSSVADYDTSPARSEYSRSTQPSAVSSPYANSELYLHRIDSPQIKIECPLDQAVPRIDFSKGNNLREQPQLWVDPDHLMAEGDLFIEERLRSVLGSSSSSDIGDHKPYEPRPMHRRAHSFAEFGDLGHHPRRKRTQTKAEAAKIRCDECGKPFQRAYNLKSHISNVHNKHRAKQHACDRDGCVLRFVRNTDLKRHIESVHDRLRQHICGLCGKDFPRKDTLTRHVEDGCPRRDKVRTRITTPLYQTFVAASATHRGGALLATAPIFETETGEF